MSWATVRLEDLPEEVLTLCARHLLVWERICMSQACRALHKVLQGKVLQGIKYGALEQVKNKHYTQAQLVNQYTEWLELRGMNAQFGGIIYAPKHFMHFVRTYNGVKRQLSIGDGVDDADDQMFQPL